MKVGIILGSASDKEVMKKAADILDEFGIQWSLNILSAHRVPELLKEYLEKMEADGTDCFIAGAGLAAHLPGVIASLTVLPVIGVPVKAALGGMDSLLSIVQMPKGIPVATVGINNSANAGLLAVQFLSSGNPELKDKLKTYRETMKSSFISENEQGVTF